MPRHSPYALIHLTSECLSVSDNRLKVFFYYVKKLSENAFSGFSVTMIEIVVVTQQSL